MATSIRYDNWGDEATNKKRFNLLTPGRGGRGHVVWECGDGSATCCSMSDLPGGQGCVDANGDGFLDFREVPVDLDGDCVVDGFPPAGPNRPLTCSEER